MKFKNLFVALVITLCMISCSNTSNHSTELDRNSIDSTLQVKATSILENKLTELNALSGQAIVMEAQTGNIKAMVGLERKDSADYQPPSVPVESHSSEMPVVISQGAAECIYSLSIWTPIIGPSSL